MNAVQLLPAAIIYDLRDEGAWQAAHRHRALWGRLYSDICPLDYDHIALVFRSAGERWQVWELVRLSWILQGEDLEGRAA